MQANLSLLDFYEHFGSEEQCFDYMAKARWPNGFICPRCGHNEAYALATRKLFQCLACRHQVSVTAGTVFHKLRQPLVKLFLAVYLIATHKKGMSALELQRKLGIKSYRSVWMLLHKIRHSMSSSGRFQLSGTAEVDETFVGGSRPGPRGRGAHGKALVAVAVEAEHDWIGRAYLKHIPDAGKETLGKFVREHVSIGSTLVTDGFGSYAHLCTAYRHKPVKIKEPEDAGKLLPKVHIVIANLKMWLRGTFNRYPAEKHLHRYLNEFEFRFNRRWNLEIIFDKLLIRCIQRTTITFAELKA
jgi:transposase-like protein